MANDKVGQSLSMVMGQYDKARELPKRRQLLAIFGTGARKFPLACIAVV